MSKARRISLIGGSWQRARKEHECYCCHRTIAKGEGYFRTFGKVDGKPFTVKHCRTKCEIFADTLDQHPNDDFLANALLNCKRLPHVETLP